MKTKRLELNFEDIPAFLRGMQDRDIYISVPMGGSRVLIPVELQKTADFISYRAGQSRFNKKVTVLLWDYSTGTKELIIKGD